jgi:hypothetical protein
MSKLALRLADAARSGVYWAPGDEEVLDAARGTAIDVVRVDLRAAKDKSALLAALAGALAFPDWYGGNWDALEECLGDLSWRRGSAHVLLIEGGTNLPNSDAGMLREILRTCAEGWAARGRPFFAVYAGGRNAAALPELFRARA